MLPISTIINYIYIYLSHVKILGKRAEYLLNGLYVLYFTFYLYYLSR